MNSFEDDAPDSCRDVAREVLLRQQLARRDIQLVLGRADACPDGAEDIQTDQEPRKRHADLKNVRAHADVASRQDLWRAMKQVAQPSSMP